MPARLTQEEFVRRSKELHRNEDGSPKYDYSLVEYVNQNTHVKIICKVHGVVTQRPGDHLAGKGCNLCGYSVSSSKRILGRDVFIERAKKHHGDNYDYSLVPDSVKIKDKIHIICSIHGVFHQEAKSHTNGTGCPKCGHERGGKKARTSEYAFIAAAKELHNGKYLYDRVNYKTTEHKVELICPSHGLFKITPHAHLSGQGCRKCGYEKNARTLMDYNEHTFSSRYRDTRPATLYYIKLDVSGKVYYKIGVTKDTVEERFKADTRKGVKITVLKLLPYNYAYTAYTRELMLLRKYKRYKTKDRPLKTGNGEVFDVDVMGWDNVSN